MPISLEPLDIKCKDTDCDNGLHYFRSTKKMIAQGKMGHCQVCDADVVDWDRVHKRDISDVAYTVEALNLENLRYHYWNTIKIDQNATYQAYSLGKKQLHIDAIKRLQKSVGCPVSEIFRDGMQTPKSGNILYYAQHATGSCCRKCIEEWHGIPREKELNDQEINYLVELMMYYIENKIPGLPNSVGLFEK